MYHMITFEYFLLTALLTPLDNAAQGAGNRL